MNISDGQRQLIVLYTILEALRSGVFSTVLIDEPDKALPDEGMKSQCSKYRAADSHPLIATGAYVSYRGSSRCTRMLSSTWRTSSFESAPSGPFNLFLSAVMI